MNPLWIVVISLVDDLAVPPCGHDYLFHMHRRPIGGDPVHDGLIEGHVVTHGCGRDVKPLPFFDRFQKLPLPFQIRSAPDRRRLAVFLHDGVLRVELIDGVQNASLPDVGKHVFQLLLQGHGLHTYDSIPFWC